MNIDILNHSTLWTGAHVTAAVRAVQQQIRLHVAPAWGRMPVAVTLVPCPRPGNARIVIVDDSDQADALGYHTEDPDGTISGIVAVRPTLDGGLAPSSVLSHEVIETFLDPFVDLWADGPADLSYPIEACDAVQGDSYMIGRVEVSNFLYPGWFDQAGVGQCDHLQLVSPFQIAPGGYSVARSIATGEISELGLRAAYKSSFPRMRSSRRRGQ